MKPKHERDHRSSQPQPVRRGASPTARGSIGDLVRARAPNPRETLERNLARARRHPGSTSSTMINGRQYAIAVKGTVITFECKRARHRYKIDFGSKRRRLTARLSPDACKRQASWWSEEKGGCIGACPTCERNDAKNPEQKARTP